MKVLVEPNNGWYTSYAFELEPGFYELQFRLEGASKIYGITGSGSLRQMFSVENPKETWTRFTGETHKGPEVRVLRQFKTIRLEEE